MLHEGADQPWKTRPDQYPTIAALAAALDSAYLIIDGCSQMKRYPLSAATVIHDALSSLLLPSCRLHFSLVASFISAALFARLCLQIVFRRAHLPPSSTSSWQLAARPGFEPRAC